MKPIVANLLTSVEGLADYSTAYPEEMADFPYVVYRTASEGYVIDAYRNELQTKWTVVIEVYGIQSVSSLATSISDGMKGIGFKANERDANVAGLKRIVIECHAIVDNITKIVYL